MAKKAKEAPVTIETQLTSMIKHLNDALTDAAKFDAGVKVPGVRVRKAMQDIKAAAQMVRQDITARK